MSVSLGLGKLTIFKIKVYICDLFKSNLLSFTLALLSLREFFLSRGQKMSAEL